MLYPTSNTRWALKYLDLHGPVRRLPVDVRHVTTLDKLVSLGLVERISDDRYQITPLGRTEYLNGACIRAGYRTQHDSWLIVCQSKADP